LMIALFHKEHTINLLKANIAYILIEI